MAQILILESHQALRCVLGEALESEGHRVRLAASVADGLAALVEARPDVVLCDPRSAAATGPTFPERCRAQPDGATVPIVAMSADPATSTIVQQYGCTVLPKPFDLDDLLRSIGAALRPERPERQRLTR